ncbi:hypothetical protein [Paraburkholderia humisilvae]|uniref:hypothetical protein n=1 Tax=Paraburkholderia humisilvae TaxID=627669 RepID=UPI001583D1D6|nr:hypothetical protein [Paraburkholderia humisilvae]
MPPTLPELPTPDPVIELLELCCPNPLEALEPDERPKPLPGDDRPVPLDEPIPGDEDIPAIPVMPLLWLCPKLEVCAIALAGTNDATVAIAQAKPTPDIAARVARKVIACIGLALP